MPVITVQLGKVPLVESKRRLARGITDVVCDVLEIPRREVTVLIEEFERENWADAGDLAADQSAARTEGGVRQDPEAFFRPPPVKGTPKKAATKPQRRR